METSSTILQELTCDWASLHHDVSQLLPTVQPTERELMDILIEHKVAAESWASRASADEHANAFDRVKSAVIELLFWALLKRCKNVESRKELLGALWQKLQEVIHYQANALVRNLPGASRKQNQVEEYMQEAYLQFEEVMGRFDPAIKNTMLRSFVSTFYRSRMINIAKSKEMRKSNAAALTEADDPIDESQLEEAKASERLEEQRMQMERALLQIARENERDADRVVAFRMFVIEQRENAEIAKEMKRSTSWVTKSHKRISKLLTEMLAR